MAPYLTKSFDFLGDAADLLEFFAEEPHLFFLDSSQPDSERGRYSFIGFDPFDTLAHQGPDTLQRLKERFYIYAQKNSGPLRGHGFPLSAGAVGFLGYDFGLFEENIRPAAEDDLGVPDCFFGFYDRVMAIDHITRKLHVISSGLPEKDGPGRQKRAEHRLKELSQRLEQYLKEWPRKGSDSPRFHGLCSEGSFRDIFSPGVPEAAGLQCNFSKAEYVRAVNRALAYIARGDIYQVNLSQRFSLDLQGRAFDPVVFYRGLRCLTPSAFGGYIDAGDVKVMSRSPERFLRLNGRVVQTRPMKGTRPRGKDAQTDNRMREEILNSAKEKAELLMITDLMRNDLGRVCEYGSVAVRDMRTIEEYPYVFQATSTVEGVLRQDQDCFDLIRACFPGGSVTGCPKIRAMEIIAELERARRGVYTGSMGYINFDGQMDFNILIRTLTACRGRLYFQAGGGIVADSQPEREYEETLVKAGPIAACLRDLYGERVGGIGPSGPGVMKTEATA